MATEPTVMSEDQAPQGDSQPQTTQIPIEMFEGKDLKPGDVFEFKVVSVDEKSGSVNVAYNTGDDDGGSDSLAGEFDNPPKQKGY